MRRSRSRRQNSDTNYWIGYTDLLTNSLLVLLLTIAVATFARANNEKRPLLRLSEKESFRFEVGSYILTPQFKKALDKKLPWIQDQIMKYRIDSVEVIGHTDGQPSPGISNLDLLLPRSKNTDSLEGFQSGSNTDLGLLRALAVSSYLKAKLEALGTKSLTIRPYSAGSLINIDGSYAPADIKNRAERRRIELRFTRQEDSAS